MCENIKAILTGTATSQYLQRNVTILEMLLTVCILQKCLSSSTYNINEGRQNLTYSAS